MSCEWSSGCNRRADWLTLLSDVRPPLLIPSVGRKTARNSYHDTVNYDKRRHLFIFCEAMSHADICDYRTGCVNKGIKVKMKWKLSFCVILMLFTMCSAQGVRRVSDQDQLPHHGKCEPITIPLCKDIQYNTTIRQIYSIITNKKMQA